MSTDSRVLVPLSDDVSPAFGFDMAVTEDDLSPAGMHFQRPKLRTAVVQRSAATALARTLRFNLKPRFLPARHTKAAACAAALHLMSAATP
ncbi:MAG TPA: hypothetical protein PLX89_22010 [Verrucomicrobiota bacterium]|nr:hypothetical protein [Verrucomicrobiota bacterium]